MNTCRKIAVILALCIALTALLPFISVSAEEKMIEGTFSTYTWEYPYSDDYFLSPADEYNHDFAKLTLGLALASYRNTEHPDAQDDNMLKFFDDIGFTEPQTDVFKTEPTTDSICYGLAQKKIGDTTVIACSICGGGYGLEWASNLMVGDSTRSEGFEDASEKVQAAVNDYLDDHNLSGKLCLWITGFSRGAAAANIAAADYTDSGVFKRVYAYTFGTPFTTREPGDYHNIFNIVQKEDFVPKIPLADWGYQRYGKDLFIISPETDMDYAPVLSRAIELYREHTGAEMVVNSEINYQLRILMDYLYMLVPDSATYTKYLQPLIIDILTEDDGTKDALHVLLEALERYSVEDAYAAAELKEMRDYLSTLLNVYLLQGAVNQLPADRWNPESGIANLFNAHEANEYLAMMNATDDPDELFNDNLDYIRLIAYGEFDLITVSDGEEVLKEITADGKEWVHSTEQPYSYPDAAYTDQKAIITLPADHSMQVTLRSSSLLPQTVTYTSLTFSGRTVRAQTDAIYSYLVYLGDTVTIQTASDGKAIEPSGSDHTEISFFIEPFYSPTTAMRLETNSVAHLTISGFVNRLLLVAVILLVQMIASIILAIVRKVRHRRRNRIVAFIWHFIIAALFALVEVAMWYFVPVLPIAKMIPGILTCIVIVVYAWKGCHSFSKNWKLFWIITAALAVYVILESLLIGDFTVVKVLILLAVYIAAMTAAFVMLWKEKKDSSEPA